MAADSLAKACESIQTMILELPQHRTPGSDLPSNGLYFFYQEGETCPHTGSPRIVRVGNHPRSQNTLVRRLRQHYSGNKNSSVFRKLLGGAILRQRQKNHPCLAHWEKQDEKTCDTCRPLEDEVSLLIREQFRFRCVAIARMQERNEMESRLIATLSACPVCLPSQNWLGKWAGNERVRSSGMWNSQHVGGSPITAHGLEKLSQLVVLWRPNDAISVSLPSSMQRRQGAGRKPPGMDDHPKSISTQRIPGSRPSSNRADSFLQHVA